LLPVHPPSDSGLHLPDRSLRIPSEPSDKSWSSVRQREKPCTCKQQGAAKMLVNAPAGTEPHRCLVVRRVLCPTPAMKPAVPTLSTACLFATWDLSSRSFWMLMNENNSLFLPSSAELGCVWEDDCDTVTDGQESKCCFLYHLHVSSSAVSCAGGGVWRWCVLALELRRQQKAGARCWPPRAHFSSCFETYIKAFSYRNLCQRWGLEVDWCFRWGVCICRATE